MVKDCGSFFFFFGGSFLLPKILSSALKIHLNKPVLKMQTSWQKRFVSAWLAAPLLTAKGQKPLHNIAEENQEGGPAWGLPGS